MVNTKVDPKEQQVMAGMDESLRRRYRIPLMASCIYSSIPFPLDCWTEGQPESRPNGSERAESATDSPRSARTVSIITNLLES